jgi:beta-N-acetylhexosaminidase
LRLERLTYRRMVVLLGLLVLLAVVTGVRACSEGGGEGVKRLPAATGAPEKSRSSFLGRLVPAAPERAPRGPSVARSVADLARRLPLERKVAQLFLIGYRGRDLTAPVFTQQLRDLDIGGIVPSNRNYAGPQQLAQQAGEAVVVSQQEKHVPPLVAADQIGGDFSEFPDLPPSDAPGDQGSPRNGGRFAAQTASTLRPLGVNAVFAPALDVSASDGGVLGAAAFSDDPHRVAAYATTTTRAYDHRGVLPIAGHFPGLGGVSTSPDEGPAEVGLTVSELEGRDLIPFEAAIRAGVPAIQISNASYATDDFVSPASLSKGVMVGLLRHRLHFRGVAVTGDLASPAVSTVASAPDAAVEALRNGADMLYISGPRSEQEAAYVAVLNAARRGHIPRARVEEAVLRVLQAKQHSKLITK